MVRTAIGKRTAKSGRSFDPILPTSDVHSRWKLGKDNFTGSACNRQFLIFASQGISAVPMTSRKSDITFGAPSRHSSPPESSGQQGLRFDTAVEDRIDDRKVRHERSPELRVGNLRRAREAESDSVELRSIKIVVSSGA